MLATSADAKYVQQIERLIGGKIELADGSDRPQEAAPADSADSPREENKSPRKRSPRRGKRERPADTKPAAQPVAQPAAAAKVADIKESKPRAEKRPPQKSESPETGMGDHVPAFLQR
jgi:hypothetical protein